MKKLSNDQYTNFWRTVHLETNDDLAAVCFPDKPVYFNRFFDRIQKYVLNKCFKRENLNFKDKRVLDIGCGRGRWLSFFQDKYGTVVTGIDLSKDAVETCRGKGFDAHEGSITQMPFADNSYDFVSSITVLLHLPYELKEEAVSEISRVLKPGGEAILIESTWNDPSPHVYGLAIPEWEKLFNKHGMNLIHKSGHYFNLFRRRLPDRVPSRDFIAIYLDYPVEFALMNIFYVRQSDMGLQHVMIFQK